MAATIQDTSSFAGPREFAAFLTLTPKQNSSGGKQKLGRISKMGNRNLRKLLVVGAHAVLFHRKPHTDPLRMRVYAEETGVCRRNDLVLHRQLQSGRDKRVVGPATRGVCDEEFDGLGQGEAKVVVGDPSGAFGNNSIAVIQRRHAADEAFCQAIPDRGHVHHAPRGQAKLYVLVGQASLLKDLVYAPETTRHDG